MSNSVDESVCDKGADSMDTYRDDSMFNICSSSAASDLYKGQPKESLAPPPAKAPAQQGLTLGAKQLTSKAPPTCAERMATALMRPPGTDRWDREHGAYTTLRAHETPEQLVCRPLIVKTKIE